MNLSERIDRRRGSDRPEATISNLGPLSPAVHLPEPIGRGSELEELLDHVEPAFEGNRPDPLSVYGPSGVGKSALVTALFGALDTALGRDRRAIATATRSTRAGDVRFVRVDARRFDSDFRFYQSVLDALSEAPVPERGTGTDRLTDRIETQFETQDAVVAVDHVDTPNSLTADRVTELVAPFEDDVTTWFVGREPHPDRGATLEIGPNRTHELVDILTERASQGLAARNALDHHDARRIAEWAEGSAHDALAALLHAALLAAEADEDHISSERVEDSLQAVPRNGVHVGRLLALPENRRALLFDFVEEGLEGATVAEAAATIDDRSDLAEGTITRFLYELADSGVLERVEEGDGRSASRLACRFCDRVFAHLHAERQAIS
ncbi:MAG: AAA family ATPase [Halanaeroarchaeum sp.]